MEFNIDLEDRVWIVEANDTVFYLRSPNPAVLEHNLFRDNMTMCGMETGTRFELTFSVNATDEEEKNAACNSFLAFVSFRLIKP